MADGLEIVEWPSVMVTALFGPAYQGQVKNQ